MGKCIAYGRKISLGIYMLLGALGIGYIIWEINHSGYEWTQKQTVDAIIGFCVFYILMIAFYMLIIWSIRGRMEKKVTKRMLLLDIPIAILVAIGLLASMVFVEEQNIPDLAFLMALLLSPPVVLLFVRMGYKQWIFYSELKIILEERERK
ncbi:hypothetical protein [Bacillus thuringiensis]|uniref:hypothetical protein n=1 Tax=Bacillus thuringiensis TaxID=1428 RepID=UPI000BEDB6D8|nr:hypothetical protein [Bacillus thuringiensis]EKS8366688.1 hypothetical protein [Bacillus cereus]EKS8371525.1 hypothetical protein [Bacillus cereus]MBG9497455.1 hypothetical protein [Bacillus thuringiensis]MED3391706.1 hypothetical protein [Bacillus thuringiensis]PDY32075.1 hypothetical protein COM85_31090 [Bacillus thuringiensis]